MLFEDESSRMVRRIVDASMYMTLATADGEGRPWASPVWYAPAAYTEFFWASKPEARHSRNVAVRAEVGIVIFDSTVPTGAAEAVYMEAVAEEVADAELERGIAIYSGRSQETGAGAWTLSDVRPPAPHRLYRATAATQFVLGRGDLRVPVNLGDR